jgi:predicted glycosyltransferase
MKVLMYCQHVLGIGHLVRTAEIARALSRDADVTLVSGGPAVGGLPFPAAVQLIQLPAIQTDEDFGALENCGSVHTLQEIQDLRREKLVRLFDDVRPDALVIELFPFGRKHFAFELMPLLERVRSRRPETLVACSVRDILVEKADRVKHEERVCGIINGFFDLILVHGDPRLVRLEETFHRVEDLDCDIRYTGFVQQDISVTPTEPVETTGPVIVASIGSGRYREGQLLLEQTIRAATLLQEQIPHRFHLFAGPFIPEAVYADLRRLGRNVQNVEIETYSPHFAEHLKRAALSISMGGYNTIMNLLAAGVPGLVYPYTASDDREQHIRGAKLERLGVIELLHPSMLTPLQLAGKILGMLAKQSARIAFDMDGASQTASILRCAVAAKMARLSPVAR